MRLGEIERMDFWPYLPARDLLDFLRVAQTSRMDARGSKSRRVYSRPLEARRGRVPDDGVARRWQSRSLARPQIAL
jgi:hypothetical protein